MRGLRCEVEMSATVGGFPINFSGQCDISPDDRNIRKGIALSNSISIVRPYTIEVAYIILRPLWAMRPDLKRVINIPEPQQQFVLRRVKSQLLKMLLGDVDNDV
jgi:hypothetical protein